MAPFDDLPMQSLTNGYYDECPLCDSLIVIGEVRLNTNTGKIVGFVKRPKLHGKFPLLRFQPPFASELARTMFCGLC